MAKIIKNGVVVDSGSDAAAYATGELPWDSIATVVTTDATTTGQTLVDVTGLAVPVAAASKYQFEAVLETVASADTTGMQVGVNVTQTPVTVLANASGNTTTTTNASVVIVANATATAAFNTTSAGKGLIVLRGTVTTHATLAGTLSIQHLKVTSGTSTVKVGSTFKVRKTA